jgi:ketoreductase RED2
MDLAGQAVIVTGSSSGIGEAVARRLAGLGAGVVVNSATSVVAGKQVAADLPDAVYVQGDIGDPATAAALIAAAEQRWGRLDGLVNNAGVTVDVPLPDLDAVTVEHWNTVLRTNVVGTFLVSQAALPLLRHADDGWIINITSLAGVRQTGSSLPYAVSKAALDHMTTIMAKHVGAGVRINAVAPGLVATPWTEDWHERKAGVELAAPLHRVATAEDIADATMALIGTRYATGQTLVVDGGLGLVI